MRAHRADIVRLRDEFGERNCVRLRDLLEPKLVSLVLSLIEKEKWERHEQPGFDANSVLAPGAAGALLHFVSNWPAFLHAVHEITGCGPFTWFGGMIYRMRPDAADYDAWHSDNTDGHLAALSLNLSPRGYEGGLFQLRHRDSEALLVEIANTRPGDALLFRISPDLLHQVTRVEGTEPKTAFAGWFTATDATFADRVRSTPCVNS
jgi:hypothetical protein